MLLVSRNICIYVLIRIDRDSKRVWICDIKWGGGGKGGLKVWVLFILVFFELGIFVFDIKSLNFFLLGCRKLESVKTQSY